MSTLPPIDNSLLPADVRTGSKTDQDNYKSALQFERQLVEQLTQSLADRRVLWPLLPCHPCALCSIR